jgi:hypothetical protein
MRSHRLKNYNIGREAKLEGHSGGLDSDMPVLQDK